LAETLEILLKDCRRGRAKSQETLYRRFAGAMYGLCLQYSSCEEDAQDIMQEGFVKVFRKLDQVKNPSALPGWIRRIMINTALEKYRSQVVLQRIDDNVGEAEGSYDNAVFDKLSCQELVDLIQTLSPKYRMVFNLYAIEGYTHQEISEELGISVGTSKSKLSTARKTLQAKEDVLYGTAREENER